MNSIFPGDTDLDPGPRKRVCGCAALETPFSRLNRSSQGSNFKQMSLKVSSQDPLLRFLFEMFASSPSVLAQISALKPPNLEMFSSQLHKPPLSEAKTGQRSVRKSHTSESGPHSPT